MSGTCSMHGREEECMQNQGWKTKKLYGRPRYSWEDNIKMNLKEIEYKGVDWIHLAQDRAH